MSNNNNYNFVIGNLRHSHVSYVHLNGFLLAVQLTFVKHLVSDTTDFFTSNRFSKFVIDITGPHVINSGIVMLVISNQPCATHVANSKGAGDRRYHRLLGGFLPAKNGR